MRGFFGYEISKIKKSGDPDTTWLERNYLKSASAVAIVTAFVSLKIIYWMNADGLDLGLGLASIGIVTFIGTTLASSIFEEHRHGHNKNSKDGKEKSKNQFLQDAIVGKGIMRKALAASLVMTYIVLIGMSFSEGSMNSSFENSDVYNSTRVVTNGTSVYITDFHNSTIIIDSNNVSPNIAIKDIVSMGGKLKVTTSNSLVQHFTTIISLVIGFYFASNIVTSVFDSRKKQLTAKEIIDIRLASEDIDKEEHAKIMDTFEDKSSKEPKK